MNVQILGTGTYLPKKICYSSDLEEELGLPKGYITKRNGVKTRRVADQSKGETTSQMCAWAAKEALNAADLSAENIDLILFASASQEQAIPDTAPLIQEKLGLGESGIPCFSVHSTCLSFLTALDVASSFIASKRYKNILITCCELSSISLNPTDAKTYTLFGDAAAAVVVAPTLNDSRSKIERTHFSTFGTAAILGKGITIRIHRPSSFETSWKILAGILHTPPTKLKYPKVVWKDS